MRHSGADGFFSQKHSKQFLDVVEDLCLHVSFSFSSVMPDGCVLMIYLSREQKQQGIDQFLGVGTPTLFSILTESDREQYQKI